MSAEPTTEQAEAEDTSCPLILADPAPGRVNPQEFGVLAEQMANSYRRMVNFYKTEFEKSLPEALEMAAGTSTDAQQEAFLAGLRAEPPELVSWHDLRNLEDACPGDALRKWEEVKAWAADELLSGMRGAVTVEELGDMGGGPLARARYIALVQEMAKDWQPLTGIEFLLVQQMAQAYTMQLYWTGIFGHREIYNIKKIDHERGEWEPHLVSRQEALDNAAAMVDRWNRMFLRVLRQLRDLRRYSPVVINNPGQVNVAQQQVNVSESNTKRAAKRSAKRRHHD